MKDANVLRLNVQQEGKSIRTGSSHTGNLSREHTLDTPHRGKGKLPEHSEYWVVFVTSYHRSKCIKHHVLFKCKSFLDPEHTALTNLELSFQPQQMVPVPGDKGWPLVREVNGLIGTSWA